MPKTSLHLFKNRQGAGNLLGMNVVLPPCVYATHISHTAEFKAIVGSRRGRKQLDRACAVWGFLAESCSSSIYYWTSKRKTTPPAPNLSRRTNLLLSLPEGKTKHAQMGFISNTARWCRKVSLWASGWWPLPKGIRNNAFFLRCFNAWYF